jgi:hypothetical protein
VIAKLALLASNLDYKKVDFVPAHKTSYGMKKISVLGALK